MKRRFFNLRCLCNGLAVTKSLSRQASVYIANYSDTQQVIGQVVVSDSYVQIMNWLDAKKNAIISVLSALALLRNVLR